MFCEKCGNNLNQDDKFCAKCGSRLFLDTPVPEISVVDKKKNKKLALIWLLTPVVTFIGLIVVWGLTNALFQAEEVEFMNNVLIPFCIGLTVIFSPVALVFAVYYYQKSKH